MKVSYVRFARGFTMIELLVVMAVLGVLAAAVMPLGETLVRAQRERELRQALIEIRQALDDYKRAADAGIIDRAVGDSGYPANLSVMVIGVADARAPQAGKAHYFLRRIPRDPFADSHLPAEQTWRLRSYASPPERPEAGVDVFDVHSSSDGIALDGTAYARW
jgi:general secretion pathway protein G